MWALSLNPGELVIRAIPIYLGIFLIFRFIGKKQLGEMSPFDFVLLLIVSESIGDSLTGEDKSITGSLISAFTLVFVSYIIDTLSYKSRRFEKLMEGEAKVLIADGKIDQEILKKFKITPNEVLECLREKEIESIEKVKRAVLETNDRITVIKK